MTLEINTTGVWQTQVLRHRSMTYQNFHNAMLILPYRGGDPLPELRRQDTKNRQNSIDDVDPFVVQKYEMLMQQHFKEAMDLYKNAG